MDNIVYTDKWTDLNKLMSDEDSPLSFTHTPFVVNGNEAIALVRGDVPKEFEVLGTYDEVFADPTLDAKYKGVYPYDVELSYTDEDGKINTYLRPKRIGEFE